MYNPGIVVPKREKELESGDRYLSYKAKKQHRE